MISKVLEHTVKGNIRFLNISIYCMATILLVFKLSGVTTWYITTWSYIQGFGTSVKANIIS